MATANLTEIKAILNRRREELALEFGVTEIGIFGSAAKGALSEDSDIDILVSFSRPVGFFKFLELEERLKKWLGRKADLVTRAALKPYIGRQILKDVAML